MAELLVEAPRTARRSRSARYEEALPLYESISEQYSIGMAHRRAKLDVEFGPD